MNATVTCAEVQKLLEKGGVTLVDVLNPEDYAAKHIAGARNACVYEMVFLDRIGECVADKDTPVVVYDASGSTRTAFTAREKLERAGYRSVAVLEGGLASWCAAGLPLETGEAGAASPGAARDGHYVLDLEKSGLEWIGRNINSRHYGRINFSEGEVSIAEGIPACGHFVLNMSSITNQDLQDAGWREMLHRHLKSEDFFDVERFPKASLVLNGASKLSGSTPGTPNVEFFGTLTIKETARAITFTAVVDAQSDGSIKAQAALDFDRTLWGVTYGSGKFYERLGMHLVHDLISIELFLVARPD
jgi:rhodanese-related sulfurtransferase